MTKEKALAAGAVIAARAVRRSGAGRQERWWAKAPAWRFFAAGGISSKKPCMHPTGIRPIWPPSARQSHLSVQDLIPDSVDA